jgi:hypothetical protein
MTYLALVVGMSMAECSCANPLAKDTSRAAPVLERHALELDGDSVPDSILVFRGDSSHAETASKIEVALLAG